MPLKAGLRFGALVVAAFFVRNAIVLFGLAIVTLFALAR